MRVLLIGATGCFGTAVHEARPARVSGRAWITSFNQLVLDPTDPFQEGFVVGRPWQPER